MAGPHTRPELKHIVAMLDHEVRTPLSALVGFADLLTPGMSEEDLRDVVRRVKSCAEALTDVIDNLSDLCRVEPWERSNRLTRFELPELIKTVVESLSAQRERSRARMIVDLDRRIPSVLQGPRAALRQVLTNLAHNALKFTEQGQVCIRVERVSASDEVVRLRYSVLDTGRGIPAEMQDAIFLPGVQVQADDARAGGRGLGLSVCASLVEAMGSLIELESDVGRGSAFRFELTHPISQEPALHSSVTWRDPVRADTVEPRVLIVDDDDDNLELLGRLVRREGLTADLAHDGYAALSMFGRARYALVLTDLRMSPMDGFELGRRLRECEASTKRAPTPLVALTATSLLMGDTGPNVDGAFDAVLLKPVRPRVLARLLEPYKPVDDGIVKGREAEFEESVDTSVISLVPDYLSRRSEDLAALRAFLDGRGSIRTVAKIGHNLKGTAFSYGFPRMSELGEALEDAARAKRIDRIRELVDVLEGLVANARSGGRSTSPEMKRFA